MPGGGVHRSNLECDGTKYLSIPLYTLLCVTVAYCTLLYLIVSYCAQLYLIVPYLLYCTLLCLIVLYCMLLYPIVPYCILLTLLRSICTLLYLIVLMLLHFVSRVFKNPASSNILRILHVRCALFKASSSVIVCSYRGRFSSKNLLKFSDVDDVRYCRKGTKVFCMFSSISEQL